MNFYYSARAVFLLVLCMGPAGIFLNYLQAQSIRSSAQKEIRLFDPVSTGGNTLSVRASSGTSSYVLQLPASTPAANQVLGVSSFNGGVANLTWSNSSSVAGNGADGQITFWTGNSSQSGSSQLFWDNNNKRMGIGTSLPTEKLTISEPGNTGIDVSIKATAANELKSQLTFGVKNNSSTMVGGAIGSDGGEGGGIVLNGKLGDITSFTPHFLLKSDGEIFINGATDLGNYKIQIKGDLLSESARFTDVNSGGYSSNLGLKNDGTLTRSSSDFRLKKNIETIKSPLEKVVALRGVTYNWKDSSAPRRMMGMIAQEVLAVVPELVFQNESDGFYGINYGETSGLLIEAIKEQQKMIQELKKDVSALQLEISSLKKDLNSLKLKL